MTYNVAYRWSWRQRDRGGDCTLPGAVLAEGGCSMLFSRCSGRRKFSFFLKLIIDFIFDIYIYIYHFYWGSGIYSTLNCTFHSYIIHCTRQLLAQVPLPALPPPSSMEEIPTSADLGHLLLLDCFCPGIINFSEDGEMLQLGNPSSPKGFVPPGPLASHIRSRSGELEQIPNSYLVKQFPNETVTFNVCSFMHEMWCA